MRYDAKKRMSRVICGWFMLIFMPIVNVFAGNVLIEISGDIDVLAEYVEKGASGRIQGVSTSYEESLTARNRQVLKEIRERQFNSKDDAIALIFASADKSMKRGDYEEALLHYRILTTLDPLNMRANDLKIQSLRILKLYDQGIREYERLVQRYGENLQMKTYLETLRQARDDQKLLDVGIKKAMNEAMDLYRSDRARGSQNFSRIITSYADARRTSDVLMAITSFLSLMERDGNWEEAIKMSNRYLELTQNETNEKDWRAIEKTYVVIFKNVMRFFNEKGDSNGYVQWLNEYKNIENKRFAAEYGDLVQFHEGLALMQARDYEKAQAFFLNLYLNQPSSRYSKEAKANYDGCKRAIKGVAVVAISSEPFPAEVYIDDMYRGVSPLKLEVADKDFILKVVKPPYEPYEKKISPNAAEPIKNITVKLKSSLLLFQSGFRGRDAYCPGVVLFFGDVGKVRWHEACFELGVLETEGTIFEKIDENSVRVTPGTYSLKGASFGEIYLNTGRFIEEEVTFRAGETVTLFVDGAYINDEQLPYRLTFSVKQEGDGT